MKILVMSDSHGHDEYMQQAIRRERPFDALIHLGDIMGSEDKLKSIAKVPVYMVSGNCDLLSRQPLVRIEELGGCRILMAHGDRHNVYFDGIDPLREEARSQDCRVVLFGHTHQPLVDASDPQVLVLNPGSIALPRQSDRQRSYMILEIDAQGTPHPTLEYL